VSRNRFLAWIEIATGISVFVGLMFVAVELRQSNAHATAQSIQSNYQIWTEIFQFESQYEIDLLVDKAVSQPDQLTDAELYRLDDYYSLVINAYMIREAMEDLGLNQHRKVADEFQPILDLSFYYPVSIAWLDANLWWIEAGAPEFGRSLRDAIDGTPNKAPAPWIDSWRSDFTAEHSN